MWYKLLNPNSFWNVVFLTGAVMTLLSATPVKIPCLKGDAIVLRIPVRKQRAFLILGVALIVVSLIIVSIPNWSGLLSPAEKSPDTFSRELAMNPVEGISFSLVPAAYAQSPAESQTPEAVANFQLVQRRSLTLNKHFDGELGVYLGDVHLVDPSRIVLYVTSPGMSLPTKMKDEEVSTMVPPGSIIADATLSDGQSLEFTFKGEKYKLLAHFNWYVVGEDYGKFEIIPEP